jgi:hypothetical protein
MSSLEAIGYWNKRKAKFKHVMMSVSGVESEKIML